MARKTVKKHPYRIPISDAEKIAKNRGYDQIIVFARRIDRPDEKGVEWMTTYGRNRTHCDIAKRIGHYFLDVIEGKVDDPTRPETIKEEADDG